MSTRDRIKPLLEAGLSVTAIARKVGVTAPTVCYHARRLGYERDARARYDWAAVQALHDAGASMRECRLRFGFSAGAWHDAVKRGDLVARQAGAPLDELLVAGRRTQGIHLKRRLIKAGLKEDRCEDCGIDRWLGRPLALALHHINGDPCDNRLENLRLLCPNCHSQTPNFAGRNAQRRHLADSS